MMARKSKQPEVRMTRKQFDVLVKLMRGQPRSAGCKAARLVLVDGLSAEDAELKTGASYSTVYIQVRRYAQAYLLVQGAFASQPPAGR